MAHPSVIATVRSNAAAGFSDCEIFEENSFADPPASGAPFLVIQFPYARAEWRSADEFVEAGGALFVLHLQLGAGADRGREWLEAIAALFRGKLMDGVQFFAPDSPVADDRNDFPGWYRLTMAVPYETIIEG